MRKLIAGLVIVFGFALLPGCSNNQGEDGAQKVSAPINNKDPRAATAPAAPMDESPGALAARMGGRGLKGK